MVRVTDRFERFNEADTREHRAVGGLGAFDSSICQAKVDGVHVDRHGQFVDDALDAIRNYWRTRGPVGSDFWFVANHVETFDEEVRNVVTSNCRHASSADRRAREGASFECHPHLGGGHLAVVGHAHLDLHA